MSSFISGRGYSLWWEQEHRGSGELSGKHGGVLSQSTRNEYVNFSAIRLVRVSFVLFLSDPSDCNSLDLHF